ncbi:TetR/AcrR family transcriptional regulator [Streptococcus intermedius]|uniref:TetR/AcrR family transcriptional regulator n=1 Tax=Streptococcus intermedius TaxID=1338 RepID=UPI000C83A1C1|nr:TetR/AcrR family transcriptional regulator [Streptococcus intermedius]PMR63962.1 TetR/AcrR family transcriptional regulator [Streptococcus intermedius]
MVLNTREKILEAFFELAMEHPNKMHFSLAEIAKKAGISRQAIYKRHFNGDYEILDYIHKEIDAEFQTLFQQYNKKFYPNPFIFFAEVVIPVLYTRRERISCLYKTAADPYWRDFLLKTYGQWIEQHIAIDYQKLNIPKEKAIQVLVSNILIFIEIWITQPEPTPPEQFAKTFLNLIHFPLVDYVCFKPRSLNDKLMIPNCLEGKEKNYDKMIPNLRQ